MRNIKGGFGENVEWDLHDTNIDIPLSLSTPTYTASRCSLRMHCHKTIVNNALSRDPMMANLFMNCRGDACVSHVPSVIRYPFYYDTWSVLRPIIRDGRVFPQPYEHDLTNVANRYR